jgi:uncharacterized Zn finger protein (UPF0148 family)
MPLFRKREKETEKHCIKCGTSLTQDANYCAKCGSSQNPTPSKPTDFDDDETGIEDEPTTFEIADWRKEVPFKNAEYVVLESNPKAEDFEWEWNPITSYCGFVLTNHRLITLGFKLAEKKAGKVAVLFELQNEFPLETIKDVTYQEEKIAIFTDEGKHDCGDLWEITGFRPKDPYSDYVSLDRFNYFRAKIIEQKQKRVAVTLDFSSLKSAMEKGGLVLTTLTCPKCNAPLKIPAGGTETVCQHCGSTVYAQDIFKKLKTLLG